MRGLKCSCDLLVLLVITVALLVSAWIEIMLTDTTGETKNVALLVSAWIEISQSLVYSKRVYVALLVSAWIEISKRLRMS